VDTQNEGSAAPVAAPAPDDTDHGLIARAHRVLTVLLLTVMAVEFVFLVIEQQWQNAALVLVIAGIVLVPVVLKHRFSFVIPAEFQILVVLFTFATLFLGSIREFYEIYWWWDSLLHFSSGLLLGIFGFLIVYVMNENERVEIYFPPKFAALFAFLFAVAAGALWEIFEFAVDQTTGMQMQRPVPGDPSGLTDTMSDLIIDAIGASLISLFGWWFMHRGQRTFINALTQKFGERNRHWLKPTGLGKR
jgi:hypothetical protein